MTEEPARILVVDDEATTRELLVALVREGGHLPTPVNSGRAALDLLEQGHDFDLVLLDLIMPHVSGIEVLEELAQRGATPALPVIVVTGTAEREARLAALRQGAADFVRKPVDPHELDARLRNLVALKRMRDELHRRGEALENAVQQQVKDREELERRIDAATHSLPMFLFEVRLGEPPEFEWLRGNVEGVTGLLPEELYEPSRLGYQSVGALWRSMIPPVDRPRFDTFAQQLGVDTTDWSGRFRWLRPDGEQVWLLHVGRVLKGRRIVGAVLDVSESKQLEDALQQSQKMEAVGQLAGGVAHDFNNLLTAIMSFTEFVRSDLDEDDARRDDLGEVMKAATRAGTLTKQLLDFARRRPATSRTVDLNTQLGEAASLLQRTVGQKVEVRLSPSPRTVVVRIDPVQLDQVLLNLAVNAGDAMPEGGTLRIEVGHPPHPSGELAAGRYVRLEITDSGPGIAPDDLPRVFEPFFTTKEPGAGTGLGLAICFSIVRDAGGLIDVRSEVGVGTTFTIDLPVVDEPAADDESEAEVTEFEGHGELILIAEDEISLRAIAARTLGETGYQIVLAANGKEAIRLIEELGDQIDVVFTDAVMPGADGLDVIEKARELAPGAAILLTSGYIDEATRLGRALIDDRPVLWKPYTPRTLRHAIKRALTERSMARGGYAHSGEAGDDADLSTNAPRGSLEESTAAESWLSGALVVGRDAKLPTIVTRVQPGFSVECAATIDDATQAICDGSFSVVILDCDSFTEEVGELISTLRAERPLLPVVALISYLDAEASLGLSQHSLVTHLLNPFVPDHLRRAIDLVVHSARVATLQDKLLASKQGADQFLRSLDETEKLFAEALETLRVVYQPIVRHDKSVFGYEALLRCDVPKLDNPLKVLAAAEVLGKVKDVGRVVPQCVSRDIRSLADDIAVFVNLHPSELRTRYLVADDEPLLEHARRVVLEVTERASLTAGPNLPGEIAQLRRAGYRLAVDDLGEGYSGLTSLTLLTPDMIKIDRSLVQEIHNSPLKEDIVASIVLMARRAGITVIAEGIETREEYDAVTTLGCELLQGYYLARPAPPFVLPSD